MEIGATLDHLHLSSPDPERVARFYADTYAMPARRVGDEWICAAAGRRVAVSEGPAHRLKYAAFAFRDGASRDAYAQRIDSSVRVPQPASALLDRDGVAVRDPDGNAIVFTVRAPDAPAAKGVPAAQSQHFALRTPDAARMLRFYHETLGFTVSDRVLDNDGVLRACFLRTDHLHHSLALFMAPESRFDHQSFETTGWNALREWADHMGELRVPIVWGIGRHGPGNDTFFMVHDPDGNLAEISSDIEVCTPERPAGLWPHDERTLNLWGGAIMRS